MAAFHGVNFRKLVPAGSAEAYAFATLCVAVAATVRWAAGLWFEGIVPFALLPLKVKALALAIYFPPNFVPMT
jgi:hypothetical protein